MSSNLPDKIKREVKYTNKDFGELRKELINYAKNYFPQTYSDFNESSPGMMFIEMAAYVGDVLNLYADTQLQESFLYTVRERKNLYNLSQGLGYKITNKVPSQAKLDIFQVIPSIGSGDEIKPDFNRCLVVDSNMVVSNDDGISFRTTDIVDFSYSSSLDPTDISINSIDSNGEIESYLLKKSVHAVQGSLISETFTFTDPKIYDKIVIQNTDADSIVSVEDSNGDEWHEVKYLSQDVIPLSIKNSEFNDKVLSQYQTSVPYLLCFKQTEKRFVTRRRSDDYIELQFGAGLSKSADEEIIPNPLNVGMGINYIERFNELDIDPYNFLLTKTYGLAPSNTSLTVTYSISDGVNGNVKSNTINNIDSVDIVNINSGINLSNEIESLAVNNPKPAYGGINEKPIDYIREEAMAHVAAQNRAVTREDYILRCYTMPPKYGAIAKAYIQRDTQVSRWDTTERVSNSNGLNLYVLSYDENGNFEYSNIALKENLKNYLKQYRLLTDAINIKDPYIINIGVEYEVILRPDASSYETLLRCKKRLKELLHNSKMEINKPIMIPTLITELDKVEGVQSVQNLDIKNLHDSNLGYSNYSYSIEDAKRNNIIYPSMDPCVFEVKYPNSDIRGRVVNL